MSDAIGTAIRAQQEAEQALLDRGWKRHDKGSGLVLWSKPGILAENGDDELFWRHQAIDREFPR
jgi:hypothetical protein